MFVVGVDHLLALRDGTTFEGKMVINEIGAVFGPVSVQHRDLRAEGIAYTDDYKGNALAAMLGRSKIEVRFHKAFTDDHVARLLTELAAQPGLRFVLGWTASYQGRPLKLV